MEIQVKKDCFELIPIQKADEKSLAKILCCQGLAYPGVLIIKYFNTLKIRHVCILAA